MKPEDIYKGNISRKIKKIINNSVALYKELGIIANKVSRDAIDDALGAWLVGYNNVYLTETMPWRTEVIAHEAGHRKRDFMHLCEYDNIRQTEYEIENIYPI